MKQAVPTADADQGISTIVGDQMGVVTRGEVRQLPIYGPGGYVWLPESGASVLVMLTPAFFRLSMRSRDCPSANQR